MPRSIVEGKAWISHEIARLRPTTLLDVGPGMGTYSNLLRDVTRGASWSCVEVFQPYVQLFDLQSKYDTIHCADIRYFSWPTVYDVVILGDVLEHLTLADALTVWSTARANARYIALSIPIIEYPQGAQHGNVHEAHMHAWSHDMVLSELAGVWRWQVNPKIGTYLARGTLDVSS